MARTKITAIKLSANAVQKVDLQYGDSDNRGGLLRKINRFYIIIQHQMAQKNITIMHGVHPIVLI